MHGIIYKLTNFYNGKSYIGQTIRTINERINGHFNITKEKVQKGDLFGRAKLKYGRNSFVLEILKECNNQEELDYWEIFFIAFYNTSNRNRGYNITKGGGGVFPKQRKNFNMTEEHKRKIGIANSGDKNGMHKSKNRPNTSKKGKENPNYGRKGELSKCSLEYILTFPDGHHERIIGLSEICRKYNLNKGAMGAIARANAGYHKGYTIRLIKNFMIGGKIPNKPKNKNYKKYKIIDPDGKIFIVKNGLQKFIDDNKLKNFSVSEFSRYANSKKGKYYFGYLIEKIK